MILGRITGKASTTSFQFQVTSNAKKLQFIQVHHLEYGFVLGQIIELERTSNEMIAKCFVIGYKDNEGRIKGIRTPFTIGSEVMQAEDSFISQVVKLKGEGGFLGYLEGKRIPINIDLQKILTRHCCILAKTGAGKSFCAGVMIEEIIEKRVPLLIIDPHGEYGSLRKENIDEKEKLAEWGLRPKSYNSQIKEFGDIDQDLTPLHLSEKMRPSELMKILPIQLSNTQESLLFSVLKDLDEVTFDNILIGLDQLNAHGKWTIVDSIMHLRDSNLFSVTPTSMNEIIKPGQCSILNLKGVSPEVQNIIVYKLLNDLFLARKQGKIPPFFCMIEEAHNFCPERGFGKALSTEIIRLIASEGRKFGLGLCIISQRPALVQKSVLAQCNTQIILKVTNPNDLRAISGSLEGITPETESEIQNLTVGSALVCGIVDRPLIVKIRPRKSLHGGVAVDVLGSAQKEEIKDIIVETKNFEEKDILPLIMPQTSVKDLSLMLEGEVKINTFLIPAGFFKCELKGVRFNILIDRMKGRIIIDPEKDQNVEVAKVCPSCHFPREPEYKTINYSTKLDEKISLENLKENLIKYCDILHYQECFIVFHKVL